MQINRYIVLSLSLLITTLSFAQKAERDYIRKGNRAFKDSLFVDAEVNYRKALEVNPQSGISLYNLGNTLINQEKYQEAMEQYQAAAKIEKDKGKLAQIYHNAGVLLHASKEYAKAIEAYKMSLRNNPKDDETRYNLALAQKMLEDQQNEQDQDQDQDQQDQNNQDQENQEDQNQQQNQQEQQDQQQPEERENELSKENVEQMLNSVMQDEKDVQEKVQKQMQVIQSRPLEKDW